MCLYHNVLDVKNPWYLIHQDSHSDKKLNQIQLLIWANLEYYLLSEAGWMNNSIVRHSCKFSYNYWTIVLNFKTGEFTEPVNFVILNIQAAIHKKSYIIALPSAIVVVMSAECDVRSKSGLRSVAESVTYSRYHLVVLWFERCEALLK